MAINPIQSVNQVGALQKPESVAKPKASFIDVLKDTVTETAESHKEADSKVKSLLSGGDAGIHETMIAVDKADIKLRLMVQVKNRVVEAYREMMRMQG